MRSIARRTAVGAALLLIMPVAVWISGWRWQPGDQSWLLKAAFWVTETVTQPRGRHYASYFIRLVSLVSAFSPQSRSYVICYSGSGNSCRTGS